MSQRAGYTSNVDTPAGRNPRGDKPSSSGKKEPLPIGALPGERDMLLTVLHSRHGLGKSGMKVLKELHMLNDHPTEQWIAYVIDNLEDIACSLAEFTSTREPQREPKRPSRPSSLRSSASTLVPGTPVAAPSSSTRRTRRERMPSPISDMYADPPESNHAQTVDQTPNDEDDTEPEGIALEDVSSVGSRSPSPDPPIPAAPSPTGRHAFTSRDREYMLKTARHIYKHQPKATTHHVLQKIAEKATHHSYRSWHSYAYKHSDLRREMNRMTTMQFTSRDVSENRRSSPASETIGLPEELDDTASVSDHRSRATTESDDDIILPPIYDGPEDAAEDEQQMGRKGSSYKPADDRVMARFIASHLDWHEKPVWQNMMGFHNAYPNRSISAWYQHYAVNKDRIDALARRIRPYRSKLRITSKGKEREGPCELRTIANHRSASDLSAPGMPMDGEAELDT